MRRNINKEVVNMLEENIAKRSEYFGRRRRSVYEYKKRIEELEIAVAALMSKLEEKTESTEVITASTEAIKEE